MNQKKIKHSKYRNTGLLFEFLMRQLTAEVLEKKENPKALAIIKKRFNEHTQLGQELALYTALKQQKFKSERKADFFIAEALRNQAGLSQSSLRREKFNLIKELKSTYDINKLFSSKVTDYKIYASVYKLFEHQKSLTPAEKTEVYFNLLEHITTTSTKSISLAETITKSVDQDPDLRILSYKLLLEKFNSKYSDMTNKQRQLLRAYINNVSNTNSLREYVDSQVPMLKKNLTKLSKKVEDKILKIKLAEAIRQLKPSCLTESKIVKDAVVIKLLRYYELESELKIYGK